MEQQPPSPKPGETSLNPVPNTPELEIVFPDESWDMEKRDPEFQSIYRQIKQFRELLRNRRNAVEANEGKTFAQATYDNAYKLVSSAYFLLANADDISKSGRPSNISSNTPAELRVEFIKEIKEVLDSLGIHPQELRQTPDNPQDWK